MARKIAFISKLPQLRGAKVWKIGRLNKEDCLFYVRDGKKIRIAKLRFENDIAIVWPFQKTQAALFYNFKRSGLQKR